MRLIHNIIEIQDYKLKLHSDTWLQPVRLGVTLWHDIAESICHKIQGAVSIRKTVLPGMAIPMLKIRRPNGRLIFNIGIAIPR